MTWLEEKEKELKAFQDYMNNPNTATVALGCVIRTKSLQLEIEAYKQGQADKEKEIVDRIKVAISNLAYSEADNSERGQFSHSQAYGNARCMLEIVFEKYLKAQAEQERIKV